jgi:hypothetical protein
VQLDGAWQHGTQIGDTAMNQRAVVGIERRLADAGGEAGERHAADEKLVSINGKLLDRRVSRATGDFGTHYFIAIGEVRASDWAMNSKA